MAADLAERGEVDAVVVVRGGGAKTSLNWLNEYEIARQICLMSAPVMVGVGHERDATILDEVACETFDTPSKVVAAIHSRIIDGATRALASFEKIMVDVRHVCISSKTALSSLLSEVCSDAVSIISQQSDALLAARDNVFFFSGQQIKRSKSDIEVSVRDVVGLGPKSTMQRGYCVAKQNGKPISRGALLEKSSEIELMMSDGVFKVGGLNE
jgi:exodeoxyribonuclease VII large subunit